MSKQQYYGTASSELTSTPAQTSNIYKGTLFLICHQIDSRDQIEENSSATRKELTIIRKNVVIPAANVTSFLNCHSTSMYINFKTFNNLPTHSLRARTRSAHVAQAVPQGCLSATAVS